MQQISTQGWSFDSLLQQGNRFRPVPRISCRAEDLEGQVKHYERLGTPFVVEGWHQHVAWPEIFNLEFCLRYFQGKHEKINVRNVHTRLDRRMQFSEFVEKSRTVSKFADVNETERWYAKDVECPRQWEEWLVQERVLPERFLPDGCNDLFSFRPKKNGRPDVETLMCYFGVSDTYTPCHKDLCASSGQNLMCYTEKGGSSFWFMTKSTDCVRVSQYFQDLKQELDHETHVISVSDLAKAPFDVYITEQKLGDLVLVPPRSCHQVLNHGGMSIKMSWSRMTLAGLSAALYYELPMYRRVCRPETYQIRSTVYYTLREYTKKLKSLTEKAFDTIEKGVVAKQLTTVLQLYDHLLREEYSPNGTTLISSKQESTSPGLAEDFHACDFCGADIFQGFFQCTGGPAHKSGEESFIVCPGCYVEGRTCSCQSMEQRQRQSPDILFGARWEALVTLTAANESIATFKGTGSLEEQIKYFSKTAFTSVFHAALLLHSMKANERSVIKGTKSCRKSGKSHPVPSRCSISCRKCHAARCYPHLLSEHRMHAMRAVLLLDEDSTHAIYHEAHTVKFPEYEHEKASLLTLQAEGLACPDFRALMVYNSLTFTRCQPINYRFASLGFYDQQPGDDHGLPVGPQPRSKKSRGNSITTSVDSEAAPATPRSFDSDSQRSVTNHAYIDVTHTQLSQKARKRPPVPVAQSSAPQDYELSSVFNQFDDLEEKSSKKRKIASKEKLSKSNNPSSKGEDESDRHSTYSSFKKRKVALGEGTSTSNNPTPGSSVKNFTTIQTVKNPLVDGQKTKLAPGERVSGSTHTVNSQPEPSLVPRGVKKPNFGKSPTKQSPSNKRGRESESDSDDDKPIALEFPVGLAKRKRRSDEEQPKSKGTVSGNFAKANEPNAFAASLGAAINKVADNATRTSTSGLSRKAGDTAKPHGGSGSKTIAASSIAGLGGPTRQPVSTPGDTPILVNVTELQEMVVQAAESVVRQMMGEMPPALLAAHAAVSIMTNYAAAGQFMNNNSQLQFPSRAHFAEVSSSSQTHSNPVITNNNQQEPSSLPSMLMTNSGITTLQAPTQAQTQRRAQATAKDSHHHHQQILKNGEEAGPPPRPKATKPEGRSSTAPGSPAPESRHTPSVMKPARVTSGESVSRWRRPLIEDYKTDEEV